MLLDTAIEYIFDLSFIQLYITLIVIDLLKINIIYTNHKYL